MATAAGGCGGPVGEVRLWAIEPRSVRSTVAGSGTDEFRAGPGSGMVRLAGAINETLHFRFALQSGVSAVSHAELRVAPFTSLGSSIDPAVVQVFRMHRVHVGKLPGWHVRTIPPSKRDRDPWDALVPIRAAEGGLPERLGAGESYLFWADVAIPKGTFDGVYTGRVSLMSGGRELGAVSIELTVWPLVLPDEGDAPLIGELDHRGLFRHHVRVGGRAFAASTDDWRTEPAEARLTSLLNGTLRLLRAHGVTPVLSDLTPLVRVDARGQLAVDWGAYDGIVEGCLDGRLFPERVPLSVWPMPLGPVAAGFAGSDMAVAPGFESLLREYLGACARHFKERGWITRAYALPPVSPDSPAQAVSALRAFGALVRQVDRDIRVAARFWPQDLAPLGWPDYPASELGADVDIWIPPAQFFDPAAMAGARGAGRHTWLGVDRPPFSGSVGAGASLAEVRVLGWQARQLGAEAVYVGGVNHWPEKEPAVTPGDCINLDPNVLIYPGGSFGLDEPVVSVRLKHLRDGAQDAAYRRLLREHGLEHVEIALLRALSTYAGADAYRTHFADGRTPGWIDDDGLFDLARTVMAESLLTGAVPRGVPGASDAFARTASWRRLMLRTERVDLRPEGVRMRLSGIPTRLSTEIELAGVVMNRTRKPLTGAYRAPRLPEGWSSPGEDQEVATAPPYSPRRVTLEFRADGFPRARDGVILLGIERAAPEGESYACEVRAACVTASPANRAPRIDGDLSDWPGGSANVAARFRLISADPCGGDDRPESRPSRPTTAFVQRDGANLYVAVNSEFDGSAAAIVSRQNQVAYDDLVPVGDELIELLIDPLNSGTRSPSDLFHLAVKPSGSYRVEKGIAFDPPCGRREPWPVDVEIATRVYDDRWTAELRIPLAAFGVDPVHATVWGFNVTRFDAGGQEFSTWSGAAGNAYDPLSLGNLYIP